MVAASHGAPPRPAHAGGWSAASGMSHSGRSRAMRSGHPGRWNCRSIASGCMAGAGQAPVPWSFRCACSHPEERKRSLGGVGRNAGPQDPKAIARVCPKVLSPPALPVRPPWHQPPVRSRLPGLGGMAPSRPPMRGFWPSAGRRGPCPGAHFPLRCFALPPEHRAGSREPVRNVCVATWSLTAPCP